MNKEYIQSGDMFVISTDKGLKKTERFNNMTEILETENNIEEMELIKAKVANKEFFNEKTIFNSVSPKVFSKIYFILLPIILTAVTIPTLMGNDFLAVTLFPTLVIPLILPYPVIASKAKKILKSIDIKANEYVETKLENEKQKLKQLNEEKEVLKKYDLGILNEVIEIKRTDKIKNLNLNLKLIGDYVLNKKKYNKYYKNNTLCSNLMDVGYTKDSTLFIEELIKNDAEEKAKVKTLKK